MFLPKRMKGRTSQRGPSCQVNINDKGALVRDPKISDPASSHSDDPPPGAMSDSERFPDSIYTRGPDAINTDGCPLKSTWLNHTPVRESEPLRSVHYNSASADHLQKIAKRGCKFGSSPSEAPGSQRLPSTSNGPWREDLAGCSKRSLIEMWWWTPSSRILSSIDHLTRPS